MMIQSHQWTKPTDLIPWRHCQRCGVIRRPDKINSRECKGRAKVACRHCKVPADSRCVNVRGEYREHHEVRLRDEQLGLNPSHWKAHETG